MTSRVKACEIIVNTVFNNQQLEAQLNYLNKKNEVAQFKFSYIKKLVYGVIENLVKYSFYINDLINFKKTKPFNLVLIYIFLYEYIGLNKNPALVSNGILDELKKIDFKSVGFLNAIFRKLVLLNDNKSLETKLDNLSNFKKTQIKNSIGDWLFFKLINSYSLKEIDEIADSWVFSNRISFWINKNFKEAKNKIKDVTEIYNIKEDENFNYCYWADKNIINSEIVSNNYIYIQDINSVEAVDLLDVNDTDKVWDMCAAPGGKLLLISKSGVTNLYATELSKKRYDRLCKNIETYSNKKINCFNVSALSFNESNFDKIILDAPCSSTGTIYKNKEILLKSFTDIEFNNLIKLQRELLEKSVKVLKVNGILVYSTCSLLKEENQDNIKWLLSKYNNLKLVTEKKYNGANCLGKSGFYIVKIIKKS